MSDYGNYGNKKQQPVDALGQPISTRDVVYDPSGQAVSKPYEMQTSEERKTGRRSHTYKKEGEEEAVSQPTIKSTEEKVPVSEMEKSKEMGKVIEKTRPPEYVTKRTMAYGGEFVFQKPEHVEDESYETTVFDPVSRTTKTIKGYYVPKAEVRPVTEKGQKERELEALLEKKSTKVHIPKSPITGEAMAPGQADPLKEFGKGFASTAMLFPTAAVKGVEMFTREPELIPVASYMAAKGMLDVEPWVKHPAYSAGQLAFFTVLPGGLMRIGKIGPPSFKVKRLIAVGEGFEKKGIALGELYPEISLTKLEKTAAYPDIIVTVDKPYYYQAGEFTPKTGKVIRASRIPVTYETTTKIKPDIPKPVTDAVTFKRSYLEASFVGESGKLRGGMGKIQIPIEWKLPKGTKILKVIPPENMKQRNILLDLAKSYEESELIKMTGFHKAEVIIEKPAGKGLMIKKRVPITEVAEIRQPVISVEKIDGPPSMFPPMYGKAESGWGRMKNVPLEEEYEYIRYPEGKEAILPKAELSPITRTGTLPVRTEKFMYGSRLKPKQRTVMQQREAVEQRRDVFERNINKPIQTGIGMGKQSQLERQMQKQAQQQRQFQRQRQRTGLRINPMTPMRMRTGMPGFRIPIIDTPEIGGRKRLVPGYDVYTRKGGREIKLSTRPLTKAEALSLGAKEVIRTPRASFRIEPIGKLVANRVDDTWTKTKGMFRKPKGRSRLPGESYVEKTKFRIDQPGEFKGITMKGWEAKRVKASVNKFLYGGDFMPKKKRKKKKKR